MVPDYNRELVVKHLAQASIECIQCYNTSRYTLEDPVTSPAPMPGEVFECRHCGYSGIIDREELY